MNRFACLAAAVAILILPATAPAQEVDHVGHRHKPIRIAKSSLRPDPVKLPAADALVFLNYSGRIAQISFDESVAKSIACESRSDFQLANGRLTAPNVRQGSFVSLCRLAPGSYDYRVELKRSAGELENYAVQDGKIIVQP